jgi:capsular polysaccharide transport system permease protein
VVAAVDSDTEEQGFKPRSSLEITLSVWKALFLREALSRLFASRTSMIWLFFEPIFHMSYMLVIFSVVRIRVIGGLDTLVWLLAGMLPFILFRRTASQTSIAVDANQALFTYRQVKPVDTIFVRAGLEFFILTIVAAILFFGVAMVGHGKMPADPLSVMLGVLGMWLFGLGWGLVASVGQSLIPELENVNSMLMMPLYFISGTIFPLAQIPPQYQEWVLLNPLAHGLEAIRHGFSDYYFPIPGSSLLYLYACALIMLFFGLALHRHFALKLTTQ